MKTLHTMAILPCGPDEWRFLYRFSIPFTELKAGNAALKKAIAFKYLDLFNVTSTSNRSNVVGLLFHGCSCTETSQKWPSFSRPTLFIACDITVELLAECDCWL